MALHLMKSTSWYVISRGFDRADRSVQESERVHLKSTSRCLNFLHIPKSAGSSVENVFGITVSGEPIPRGRNLAKCTWFVTCAKEFPWGGKGKCCSMPDGSSCTPGHVPPSQDIAILDSYSSCETFCVVRHPLTRLISEYSWCSKSGLRKCSNGFGHFVTESLADVQKQPFSHDCHLVPQIEYVGRGSERFCKHVLKFENLSQEFNALMVKFGLKERMNVHTNDSPSNRVKPSQEAKAAVETFYRDDYVAFGYSHN